MIILIITAFIASLGATSAIIPDMFTFWRPFERRTFPEIFTAITTDRPFERSMFPEDFTDIDECSKPHLNKCSHTCHNTLGSYRCSCPTGFVLINGIECEDIDECEEAHLNNCSHTCHNTLGSYRCSCPTGYVLINHFKCGVPPVIDSEDDPEIITVSKGFTRTTLRCIVIRGDPPLRIRWLKNGVPFMAHGDTTELTANHSSTIAFKNITSADRGQYECVATNEASSASLITQLIIYDVDGCEGYNIGPARCSCPVGFNLDRDSETCNDVDECEVDNFGCSHVCVNTYGCAHCSCPIGFQLDRDNKTCIDVDECEVDNFGCSHVCVNTQGSAHCSCPIGYHVDRDNKTCIDVDECIVNNFGCSNGCVNTQGTAYCVCPEGFHLDLDKKTCIDVNECEVDNFGCSHACVNTYGSAYCSCFYGFAPLYIDWKKCVVKPISCPRIIPTEDVKIYYIYKEAELHFSCERANCRFPQCPRRFLHCWHGKWEGDIPACISDEMWKNLTSNSNCPVLRPPAQGTVEWALIPSSPLTNIACITRCIENYRLRGSPIRRCQPDGTWSGTEAICFKEKEVRCPRVSVPLHTIVSCYKPYKEGTNWISGRENDIDRSEMSFYDLNTTCTFRCKTGYNSTVLPGAIKCQEDGTWNGTIPQCT